MHISLEIGYDQLLQLFRQLSPKQKKQFLQDIQKEVVASPEKTDMVQEPAADYARVEMQDAAAFLLNDYLQDEELAAFTALDAETFNETR